jgi:hypothetical protein
MFIFNDIKLKTDTSAITAWPSNWIRPLILPAIISSGAPDVPIFNGCHTPFFKAAIPIETLPADLRPLTLCASGAFPHDAWSF